MTRVFWIVFNPPKQSPTSQIIEELEKIVLRHTKIFSEDPEVKDIKI